MTTQNLFNFLMVLLNGLLAGLLYSYSCSVNPGLKTLTDSEYLKAMQAINIAIQNPVFFASFMGLLFVSPITTYLNFQQQKESFYFMFFTTIIYFVGVFGVTIFGNVPLNDQLARFSVSSASSIDTSSIRKTFESKWNTYHSIRTVAAIISFSMSILAIIKSKV